MRAGLFFFPIVIGSFALVQFGLVVSTPVTPAPEDVTQRHLRVQGGDTVRVELTGFYGSFDDAFVFWSTQEERVPELPVGPVEPTFEASPIGLFVPADPDEYSGTREAFLIGHRIGDAFRTDLIQPAKAFGEWEDTFNVSRTLTSAPRTVRLDATTQVGPGQNFSLSQHLRFWELRGHTLQVGYTWKCEDEALWDCRVTQLDRNTGVLAFERVVRNGDAYPASAVYGPIETGGDLSWNVIVAPHANPDRFVLRMEPPVGVQFQIKVFVSGPFDRGTYEVVGLTNDALSVRYSSSYQFPPSLIGETVFYDFVVVGIHRPDSAS